MVGSNYLVGFEKGLGKREFWNVFLRVYGYDDRLVGDWWDTWLLIFLGREGNELNGNDSSL